MLLSCKKISAFLSNADYITVSLSESTNNSIWVPGVDIRNVLENCGMEVLN